MVVRLFTQSGGLEFYTHKLVEGLLSREVAVTVICEENLSQLTHPLLTIIEFAKAPARANKAKKINHYLEQATRATAEAGPFDLVHSQQLPMQKADVVTFHNHTLAHLSESGKFLERLIDAIKIRFNPSYRRRNETDRLLATNASILIFPSHICKNDYELHFDLLSHRDSASHVVAYPGVTFEANAQTTLAPAKGSQNDHTPLTFLFVGRGFRRKGLDVLLDACREVNARGRRFKLLIAGMKNSLTNRLRVARGGLAQDVTFLGFQKNMKPIYQKAQVLILPSRVDTFGLAPLEGMAHGLPAIVSQVAGISEVLTHKADALILQNHLDPKELAGLMCELIDNPSLLQRLSLEAVHTAQAHTWGQTVDNTLVAYDRALAAKSAVRGRLLASKGQ
jgi:glycosyltransferase involved in cell wall biosynthesis